jgi:hypothetical protein
MATSVTLRATKGSALTNAEIDANFANLRDAADAAAAGLKVVFSADATYQAKAGEFVVMTLATAAKVMTPINPASGTEFGFWFTNGLNTNEIGWDGTNQIDGASDDVGVDVGHKVPHRMRYIDSTYDWRHFV